MNDTKLTVPNILRALRFMTYVTIVMGGALAAIVWGWEQSSDKTQLTTYATLATIAILPLVIDSYEWLIKKFSPKTKQVRD